MYLKPQKAGFRENRTVASLHGDTEALQSSPLSFSVEWVLLLSLGQVPLRLTVSQEALYLDYIS